MNRALRVVLIAVAIVAAIVVLFTIVFPWFDATFVNDPVLGSLPRPLAGLPALAG